MEKKIFQLSNIYLEKKQKTETTRILENIHFSVNEGEFVCIMGPTGCGKSSLMKLLGTSDVPSSGTVLFNGKNTSEKKAVTSAMLRQIGIAFQSDNLFEWKTVEKNIQVPAKIFKKKRN